MKIAVILKLVPDLVEELSINPDGSSLDTTWMRMIINEFDDHALEQAILLKEKYSGSVTVISPEFDGVDDVLFTASAKGADQIIKMTGDFSNSNNHALAKAITPFIKEIQPDLILTGVQANNDLDGSLGPCLAACLEMPFAGYISGINVEDKSILVRKEYPGGVISELSIFLPCVIGIQAAETPPRYVAVSKVRQVMKTSKIDEKPISEMDQNGGVKVIRMFQPEASSHAEMINGTPEEVAERLITVFNQIGIIK
jgi:electron transfer flavoprotein beta subunit